MTEDGDLLHRYVAEGSEAAFGEVVHRHVNLVYFASLRQLGGDVHLARDVTQLVFVEVASKARVLARHRSLAGWLYLTARNQSAKLVRSEVRRRKREEAAQAMNEPEERPEWDRIAPVLDQALCQLRPKEREAVLLRLWENRGFGEIARIQATTEGAARMRFGRSLERMRAILKRAGIPSTAAAIEAALQTQAMASCPAGLTAHVASTAMATASTQAVVSGPTIFMSAMTTKVAGTAAIAIILFALWTSDARTTERLESHLADEERTVAALRQLATRASNDSQAPVIGPGVAVVPVKPRMGGVNTHLGQIPNGASRATVQLASDGSPSWEGTPVTLQEYIDHLVLYRSEHPEDDAQLLIASNGTPASQLLYLFSQAEKAGFRNVWLDPSTWSPLNGPPPPGGEAPLTAVQIETRTKAISRAKAEAQRRFQNANH